jgi:hypothetical protein
MTTSISNTTIMGKIIPGFNNVMQFHGISWTKPYPPIERTGEVKMHHLPFFEFGAMG